MMDLVERAQAGEAEAFGRLYDQYSDTVYRYIYYRVGGKATARGPDERDLSAGAAQDRHLHLAGP